MGHVTCGDVGLERAVVLPKPLFPLVVKRLHEFSAPKRYKSALLSSWDSLRRIDDFLSSRCSKDFLVRYIEEQPELLNRVSKPGLFLNAVSEVELAIRLHELGSLPEKYRQIFVTTVTSYALKGEDLYALESLRIQSVFTSAELAKFHERVRTELIPNLTLVRLTWQSNYSSEQPPDEFMEPLLDSFSALKEEFADEPEILSSVDREVEHTQEWISARMDHDPEEDRPPRAFGDVRAPDHLPVRLRSIFDDVDE